MSDSLPNDHLAEAALLASILTDHEAIYQALQQVQPEDLYHAGHRMVYAAAISLFTKQQAIDPINLANELQVQKQDKHGTAYKFINDLKQTEHNPQNIADYARIVADAASRRRIIALTARISDLAHDPQHIASDTIQHAMQELLKLGFRHNQHGTLMPLADLYDRYVDDRLAPRDEAAPADLQTGYNALDHIITALRPSNLIILGARPSIGKSSLALNIAVNAAYQHRTVAFFSLEMAAQEVAMRILSAESGIPAQRLEHGAFPADEITNVIQYTQELSHLNFYIDESPMLSVAQISAKAQAVRIQAGLDLVIIDYLQLLSAGNDRSSRPQQRVQEISTISRDLKQMARELNVPVLAISQLNRAVESRPGARPQLSDLRESGSIEQDADVVMFLYRQDRYYSEAEWAQMHPGLEYPENIAEVIVAKHRNGPIGSMELFFQQPIMRFDNLAQDLPAEYAGSPTQDHNQSANANPLATPRSPEPAPEPSRQDHLQLNDDNAAATIAPFPDS